jgi:hypothetical protein
MKDTCDTNTNTDTLKGRTHRDTHTHKHTLPHVVRIWTTEFWGDLDHLHHYLVVYYETIKRGIRGYRGVQCCVSMIYIPHTHWVVYYLDHYNTPKKVQRFLNKKSSKRQFTTKPRKCPVVNCLFGELFLEKRYTSLRWFLGMYCCLLWIDKSRVKDKTYKWMSVRWKTKNERWGFYTSRIHWVVRVCCSHLGESWLLWIEKTRPKDKTYEVHKLFIMNQ